MIHVDPTGSIIILVQESMFPVTSYLSDQGKPILVSGLAWQAELKFSTADYCKD